MTVEAQNALLKIFEEPTAGTHFFILTPSVEIFLPTLRSRLVVIKQLTDLDGTSPSDMLDRRKLAEKFLAASKTARLALVANIIEEKEKGRAIDFLDELIRALRLKTSPETNQALLAELLHCRDYLSDRSVSLKLILENVALITPVQPA
jgi:hypothetical protein